MIKAEVTIVGTVKQTAQVKQSQNGGYYYSTSMATSIPQKEGGFKEVFVSLKAPKESSAGLEMFVPGQHVSVKGVLHFRKEGDQLYLNMNVKESAPVDPMLSDIVTGELSMIGFLGNKAPEVKPGKNGKPFMSFSAYSGDGDDDNRVFTWVRFIRFSDTVEDFLVPKALIEAKGALELQYFKDKLTLGCRVSEVNRYIKKAPAEAGF